jgi:Carbohydrate esterase, sialic acid-specific acetylesterase
MNSGSETSLRFSLLACCLVIGGACGVSQSGGPSPTGSATGNPTGTGTAGSTGAAGSTGTAGSTGAAGSTSAAGAAGGGGGSSTTGAAGAGTAGASSTGAGGSPSGSGGAAAPDGGADGPTTPLSGITVSIGGTMVPKEKVIVFLHVGHSNMAGRATDPPDLHDFNYVTAPRLWSYAKGGVWKPAVEPLSPDNVTMGKAGPGMAILHAASAVAPSDVYVVSIGHGHSGDTGGFCRNFRKGGLLYNIVMDAAMELKGKVTFGGIWGMFGTSEFADMSHASTFGPCLTGVVTDMRTDLGMPNLPVLLGDWEAGAMGKFLPSTAFAQSIIMQIHSTAAAVQPAVLIPTDGLAIQNPDPAAGTDGVHHYNFAGHKGWGERGISLLKMSGWAPWSIP